MNVAVVGWTGVGKTTVAGTLARAIAADGATVLAVEDDPARALAVTLGIGPGVEVAAVPEDLLKRTRTTAEQSEFALAKPPRAVVDDYGTAAPADVTLLKLAEPDSAGTGVVNSCQLTARKVLAGLVREREHVTVIDAVADLEHLPPEAVAAVDTLLVVVEPYYKSLEAARRTTEVAAELGFSDVRVVANKVRDPTQHAAIETFCVGNGLDLGTVVPFDEAVQEAIQDGRAPVDDAPQAAGVRAIRTVAETLPVTYTDSGNG